MIRIREIDCNKPFERHFSVWGTTDEQNARRELDSSRGIRLRSLWKNNSPEQCHCIVIRRLNPDCYLIKAFYKVLPVPSMPHNISPTAWYIENGSLVPVKLGCQN